MFTLLIVDDEPYIRKGLKNQIPWSSIGVDMVIDAASGEQALNIVREMRPDIMVTDIHMRGMTGLELIENTNRIHPKMDVIVLTGYDEFEYVRSCLRMHVRDFLLKPVDEDALLALVGTLKANKHGPETFGAAFAQIKTALSAQDQSADGIDAQMTVFSQLIRECALPPEQVRRCCFELLALEQFNVPGEAPGALDAAKAALRQLDPDACIEFTRDFLCRKIGAQAGVQIVERAKRMIEAQLQSDISVASLARSLYITPAYLSRLFKRAMGEGCNEYIVRKRIEQAKTLLTATELKVGEIARMVGYRDNNYFSLAFKKQTGTSPLSYRECARR